MKTKLIMMMLLAMPIAFITGCGQQTASPETTDSSDLSTAGQSAVIDENSAPTVVQIAVASPDHSTLVAAVKAAKLVDVLSNVGPFTVFAPVNSAFDALPAGTVDNLLKPENIKDLENILEYHVYVGVIRESMVRDGMVLNQVNGKNITLNKTGEEITVNGAKVLGTAMGSNGIVYVIDKVLIPES